MSLLKTSSALSIYFITILIIVAFSTPSHSKNQTILTQNDAIALIAQKLYEKKDSLKNKYIAIEYFSDIDGKDCEEGKNFSKQLLAFFMERYTDLQFVERSDLQSIIKNKELELSGLIDQSQSNQTPMVPVNVVISGTIASTKDHIEVFTKTTDMETGVIIASCYVQSLPQTTISPDNDKKIAAFKENPERYAVINKTYTVLIHTAEKRPMLFLIAMTDSNDPELKQHPKLAKVVKSRTQRIKENNPVMFQRLLFLKKHIRLIEKYDQQKFSYLLEQKNAVINTIVNRE